MMRNKLKKTLVELRDISSQVAPDFELWQIYCDCARNFAALLNLSEHERLHCFRLSDAIASNLTGNGMIVQSYPVIKQGAEYSLLKSLCSQIILKVCPKRLNCKIYIREEVIKSVHNTWHMLPLSADNSFAGQFIHLALNNVQLEKLHNCSSDLSQNDKPSFEAYDYAAVLKYIKTLLNESNLEASKVVEDLRSLLPAVRLENEIQRNEKTTQTLSVSNDFLEKSQQRDAQIYLAWIILNIRSWLMCEKSHIISMSENSLASQIDSFSNISEKQEALLEECDALLRITEPLEALLNLNIDNLFKHEPNWRINLQALSLKTIINNLVNVKSRLQYINRLSRKTSSKTQITLTDEDFAVFLSTIETNALQLKVIFDELVTHETLEETAFEILNLLELELSLNSDNKELIWLISNVRKTARNGEGCSKRLKEVIRSLKNSKNESEALKKKYSDFECLYLKEKCEADLKNALEANHILSQQLEKLTHENAKNLLNAENCSKLLSEAELRLKRCENDMRAIQERRTIPQENLFSINENNEKKKVIPDIDFTFDDSFKDEKMDDSELDICQEKLMKANEYIDDLHKQLRECHSVEEEYILKHKDMIKQLEDCETLCQENIKKLLREIEVVTSAAVKNAEVNHEELSRKNDDLEACLRKLGELSQELKESRESCVKNAADLSEAYADYEETLARHTKQINKFHHELQEKDNVIELHKAELERCKVLLLKKDDENEELSEQVKNLKKTIKPKKAETASVSSQTAGTVHSFVQKYNQQKQKKASSLIRGAARYLRRTVPSKTKKSTTTTTQILSPTKGNSRKRERHDSDDDRGISKRRIPDMKDILISTIDTLLPANADDETDDKTLLTTEEFDALRLIRINKEISQLTEVQLNSLCDAIQALKKLVVQKSRNVNLYRDDIETRNKILLENDDLLVDYKLPLLFLYNDENFEPSEMTIFFNNLEKRIKLVKEKYKEL